VHIVYIYIVFLPALKLFSLSQMYYHTELLYVTVLQYCHLRNSHSHHTHIHILENERIENCSEVQTTFHENPSVG